MNEREVRELAADPAWFARHILGDKPWWSTQIAIANAMTKTARPGRDQGLPFIVEDLHCGPVHPLVHNLFQRRRRHRYRTRRAPGQRSNVDGDS